MKESKLAHALGGEMPAEASARLPKEDGTHVAELLDLIELWLESPDDLQTSYDVVRAVWAVHRSAKGVGAAKQTNAAREHSAPHARLCEHVARHPDRLSWNEATRELAEGRRSFAKSPLTTYQIDKAERELARWGWGVEREYVGRKVVGVVRCPECVGGEGPRRAKRERDRVEREEQERFERFEREREQ